MDMMGLNMCHLPGMDIMGLNMRYPPGMDMIGLNMCHPPGMDMMGISMDMVISTNRRTRSRGEAIRCPFPGRLPAPHRTSEDIPNGTTLCLPLLIVPL
jgi:hypothetical protein